MASGCEVALQPLFVAQTRFIAQNRLERYSLYRDSLEFLGKVRMRDMYVGWGGVVPRQLLLSAWAAHLPLIDYYSDEVLGISAATNFQVVFKEVLLGIGAYLLMYPVFTLQRRAAAQSFQGEIGMFTYKSRSLSVLLWDIVKNEGVLALYRGVGAYTVGISVWVLAVPTLTQYFWLKFDTDARDQINDLMGFD